MPVKFLVYIEAPVRHNKFKDWKETSKQANLGHYPKQEQGGYTMEKTQIEKLQAANTLAKSIIAGFISTSDATPDVVAARTAELEAMNKKELVAHILTLEKPKSDKSVKVEDVVKALLTEPELAIFNYETIATLVLQAIPEAKTSSKTVASYASKKNEEWHVVKRERLNITPADYMALAEKQVEKQVEKQAVNQ